MMFMSRSASCMAWRGAEKIKIDDKMVPCYTAKALNFFQSDTNKIILKPRTSQDINSKQRLSHLGTEMWII